MGLFSCGMNTRYSEVVALPAGARLPQHGSSRHTKPARNWIAWARPASKLSQHTHVLKLSLIVVTISLEKRVDCDPYAHSSIKWLIKWCAVAQASFVHASSISQAISGCIRTRSGNMDMRRISLSGNRLLLNQSPYSCCRCE
ncbi:hypothetical protein ABBQ32_14206 [Trebouxia sp. C0010 RCD-2024]